ISAWSQLAAMLGSAVFTIAYPLFDPWLQGWNGFRFEDRRLIFVTLLTTACWVLVTLLAPEKQTTPIISREEKFQLMRRLMLALCWGALLIALLLGGLALWAH
ncbi:MAG: hypothetical protein ACKO6L_04315, partial [Flavobacteriales bacterium]